MPALRGSVATHRDGERLAWPATAFVEWLADEVRASSEPILTAGERREVA